MAYYTYPDGSLYFLSDEDLANGGLAMIPAGYTELSDAEAAELRKPAPMTTDELATAARAQRDALLASVVDSVNAVRWSVMTDDEKAAWVAYRQALLDVPEQSGFPVTVVWPDAPQ